jgi:D-lactate dehydrogenase (cytochrome)
MEGTISGEHGIGLEYRDMLVNELGLSYTDAMRQVKLALDPLCLLNPDKLFRLKWVVRGDGGYTHRSDSLDGKGNANGNG